MADLPVLHAVVFRVGTLLCATAAGNVREILPMLPATRIPGVADAVNGLVNVRGGLLTVLDARPLMGLDGRTTADGAILVIRTGERTLGLAVDEVRDFVELPEQGIADRDALPGVDARLVLAVARRGNDRFVLLDLDVLCAPVFGA